MKTLTRDEFESLVTTKTPVAELPDCSDIDLTINQAMSWFDLVSSYEAPSFVVVTGNWVFLGEKEDEWQKRADCLYQIGGTQ